MLYDDMLILHGMMKWCTHYYDDVSYDEHACLCTMMYTWWCMYDDDVSYDVDTLLHSMLLDMMNIHAMVWWCSSMHYDVYLTMMHAPCTLRWWWCIPYDDDDDTWWCMPCVQWKQSRITFSVIVYDEAYKEVHEQWWLEESKLISLAGLAQAI